MKPLYTCTYRVILRIVKAGCYQVAIAQVVELKSEAPGSIPGGCVILRLVTLSIRGETPFALHKL